MRENFGKRIAGSLIFRRAKKRAVEIIENPDKFKGFLNRADEKVHTSKSGALNEVWSSLMTLFRMLHAYIEGSYRNIPFKSLVAIVGSVVYFVMPFDFIPDMVAVFGFFDDAALIAWTVKSIKDDIDTFAAWETEKAASSRI